MLDVEEVLNRSKPQGVVMQSRAFAIIAGLFIASECLAADQTADTDRQSGYLWASTHAIYDSKDCPRKSKSFFDGCSAYALEARRAIVRGGRSVELSRLAYPPGYCHSNSHKCQAICDAENQLQSEAESLSSCAAQHDPSDSCDSKFNDVRDAHDALEEARSDAGGDCE
jgi:hypothetical protein